MTCGRSVVFSTNKTDRHDINEILLKVALNTITVTLTIQFLHVQFLHKVDIRIWHLYEILLYSYLIFCVLNMQGFQSGPVPGTFTRLRSCIVPAEITEPPKISGGHKKLMIASIAEFSHSNRTTTSRPSWRDIPCFKNNFTLES